MAKIAGRILRDLASVTDSMTILRDTDRMWRLDSLDEDCRDNICSVGELKALAASALTQAQDKPKKGRAK